MRRAASLLCDCETCVRRAVERERERMIIKKKSKPWKKKKSVGDNGKSATPSKSQPLSYFYTVLLSLIIVAMTYALHRNGQLTTAPKTNDYACECAASSIFFSLSFFFYSFLRLRNQRARAFERKRELYIIATCVILSRVRRDVVRPTVAFERMIEMCASTKT